MYEDIPEHLMTGLKNYIESKVPTGGFLRAVLCNDLTGAVLRGTPEAHKALPSIIHYLYWEAPTLCWGDIHRYEKWTSGRAKSNE